MRWIGLVVLLCSCIEPDLVVCDDGTACASGSRCTSRGCVSPAQYDACASLEDGATCTLTTSIGRCTDGACFIAVCGNERVEAPEVCDDGNQVSRDGCSGSCMSDESCGNGIVELDEECDCGTDAAQAADHCQGINGVGTCSELCRQHRCGNMIIDPGEACDDGNALPGDGCNFDCTSKEVCGNNIVDYFAGEQCDDGGRRRLDGCSASCRNEDYTWRLEDQSQTPAPRVDTALAYDAARQRVVLFGGTSTSVLGDTWEYDRASWKQRAILGPAPRRSPAIVYDSRRQRIVLYGGGSSAPYGDTWEFDGVHWTLRASTAGPPSREAAGIAYDHRRGRVVLFGGARYSQPFGDTWEYDGTAWTQVTFTTPTPAARSGAKLAFDFVRGRVVLFGGRSGSGPSAVYYNDLWEFDGTAWNPITTTGTPSGRTGHTMTFDPVRRRLVVIGSTGPTVSNETWELEGTAWSAGPAAPSGFGRVATFANDRVVLVGNNGSGSMTTHEYDGASFTPRGVPLGPGARSSTSLTYDAGRARTVMFSGFNNVADTWEYDGADWFNITPATTTPEARFYHATAYDGARRRVVMFGGLDFTNIADLDETWEWDGVDWELIAPMNDVKPPPRSNAGLAYDASRSRIVLFGGTGFGDTWEYDGTTWTERVLSVHPSMDTYSPRMVYDAGRRKVVLLAEDGTTWELDGVGWVMMTPTVSPPARIQPGIGYDGTRVVIYGGASVDGEQYSDVWAYDGTTWSEITPLVSPPVRLEVMTAFHAATGRMVMFSGYSAPADTWTLGYEDVDAPMVCSSALDSDGDGNLGCADTDCWGICQPLCTASTTACVDSPRCGDGTCSAVESCRTCAVDCPACIAQCGDFVCDAAESTSCPGDCP